MREGTKNALMEKGHLDESIVKQAGAAADEAPPDDRVRAGLEMAIELAEIDPIAARSSLRALRGDHDRLAELEAWIGGDSDRVTFGLGAAIQLAETELGSPEPDLAALAPELLRWLVGDW